MFGNLHAGRGSLVAAGLFLAAAMGGNAQAQEAAGNCGCLAASPPAGQTVGQLASASGTVNVLGPNGWTEAAAGTPLYVGSRIETGPASNASVQIGNCALPVGEQSQLSVTATGDGVCVAVDSTQPSFQYGQAPETGSPSAFGLPAGLFAGTAIVGGIIAVATEDEDRRVSP